MDTSVSGMPAPSGPAEGKAAGHGASTSAAGGSSTQSGPPYFCPTCNTSYSRLEYLRRHERRHADIRPFVCDCGKGFSRSDVLSRHKRQCAVHLSGGTGDGASKDGTAPSGGAAKKAAGTKRKSSGGAGPRARKSSSNGAAQGDKSTDSVNNQFGQQQYDPKNQQQGYGLGQYPPQQNQQQRAGVIVPPQPYQPMGSVQQQGSFPFPLQPGMSQGGQGSAQIMPPAPYGGNDGAAAGNMGAQGQSAMSHLSALSNFVGQQHPYPSSPEGTGQHSQHGSPRFTARDMSRHNSGSSRFSLRKSGGSFDHIGPRGSNSNQAAQQQYSQDFWEALDPAAKTATGTNTDYVSATSGASQPPLSLADGTGTSGISTTPGIAGLNTPRGDLQRFAVSSGPLSPFSSIALNSTMSPYLNAFSNARDTPFVASPSRGMAGTPGSSLNVFDWTMRPPSKPASSSQRRDSTGNVPQQQGTGSANTSPSNGKRKHEGEDGSRKSPRIQPKTEEELDEDQRSAAELLDSFRNSAGRQAQSKTASEAGSTTSEAAAATGTGPEVKSEQTQPGTSAAADTQGAAATSDQSFFEQGSATAGPEALRLNLQQGGTAQPKSGSLADKTGSNTLSSSVSGAVSGVPASVPMAASSSGGFDVPQKTWDAILNSEGWFAGSPKNNTGVSAELASLSDVFPSTGMTPLSAGTLEASTKWLMSPGVQQIISSFAPQPGDFGSYFAGAAPTSTSSSTQPSLGTTSSTTPAVSSGLAPKSNSSDTSAKAAATPSILTSSQALERALADPKNPFYVSTELFRACYTVPHWNLPSAARLSMLALHAQQNLVKHVPIIHEPTFRLDLTPGCLAFALCMLGCHEQGRQWWTGAEVAPAPENKPATNGDGTSTEDASQTKLTRSRYDEEDGQILVRPLVMEEKTDMLVRSFDSRTTSEKDRVSVVQVILLFELARLISHDEATRAKAADDNETLVTLARRAGIFDVHAEHADRHVHFTPEDAVKATLSETGEESKSSLTTEMPKASDNEKLWRRWAELAGRRRTAYSVFVADSTVHLDAGKAYQMQATELEHLPLPSPDTVWRAPNVDAWKPALEKLVSPTFGEALRELLRPAQPTSLSGRLGAFARFVLVIALLRGVLHVAQDPSDTASPLQAFMPAGVSTAEQGPILQTALKRWREAWDQDDLCLSASGPQGRSKHADVQAKDKDLSAIGSHHLFTAQTASGVTGLMDDALPFYWVATIALERAGVKPSTEGSPSPAAACAHIASQAQIGEGFSHIELRALLRASKSFVEADEQVSG